MRWRFWGGLVLLWPLLLQADDRVDGQRLAATLLALTGTSAVFDSTTVQQALLDPMPWLSRPERLVALSGLHAWSSPRVWLLREEDGHWVNMAGLPEVRNGAAQRGLLLSPVELSPDAVSLASGLWGQAPAGSAALPGMLAAHQADVLVLVRNRHWRLWGASSFREGELPDADIGHFPGVLAERLAAEQQWPEAADRAVLRVENVPDLKALLAVQAALQGLTGVRQVQLIRVQHQEAWFTAQNHGGDVWRQALGAEPRLPIMRPLPGVEAVLGDVSVQLSPLVSCRWEPDAMTLPLPVQAVTPVQSPL